MEKYTSHQKITDEVLDNISIKSDDTDFLLSSDANDILESLNDNIEMPEFNELATHYDKIDIIEETHKQGARKPFDFPNNYSTNREDDLTDNNLSGNNLHFVQRLRSSGDKSGENVHNEEHPNILMNSMNKTEIEEFGRRFLFSTVFIILIFKV